MKIEAHLSQLSSKHAELEKQIETEMRAPLPDTMRLSNLKRQKLHIKDRIMELSD